LARGLRITPLGGVGEVGGNKFYIEAGGEGILIDFGISYSAKRRFFGGYLRPKKHATLLSLLSAGAVPRVRGLYDEKLFDPEGICKELLSPAPELDPLAVVVSHPHQDHVGHVSLLRRDITVGMGRGSYEIARTRERTRSTRTIEDKIFSDGERRFELFRTGDVLRLGSFEIRPIHVDHSVPGSYGLLIHHPEGGLAYSGDLRMHGPKSEFTREFLEAVSSEGVEALMLEGTRIDDASEFSEAMVEAEMLRHVSGRRGLVAVLMGLLDYDRFSSVVRAAEKSGRTVIVTSRMAAMLESFNEVGVMPDEMLPGKGVLRVLLERRGEGRFAEQDYRGWEKELIERFSGEGEAILRDVDVGRSQEKFLVVLNSPDEVLDLLYMRPAEDSILIYSTSEPHTEEQEIDRERIDNWALRMGMMTAQIHSSGHASQGELREIIAAIRPRVLIPIHTEAPELFRSLVEPVSPATKLINGVTNVPINL